MTRKATITEKTTEQNILFAKTFGCCRKIYNLMLADKIESYKQTGRFASVTPARYKKEYPYLKEVDSLALANKQLDLQRAFQNSSLPNTAGCRLDHQICNNIAGV